MVSNNIAAILKLEKEEERELSSLHRASHKVGWFVGTVYFVTTQLALVAIWVLWNIYQPAFDPYPFPLLSTVLALEAVLLTSFVLIRQNSMDLRAERRNHLDLQINLLAEKEASSILNALNEIAARFDVDLSTRAGQPESLKDMPIESIAHDLKSRRDRDER
jgi:uncharacterized membrane protein